MDIQKHLIESFLEKQVVIPRYDLDEFDKQTIKEEGVEEYIFQKITDSKFRRTAIDEITTKDTHKKIEFHVKKMNPISFSLPFGAYKNWKLWSYPEPEWAEVFNLNYMLRYVSPISSGYSPGVVLNYSFGDEVMHIVSNMPSDDTERYINILRNLINFFQKHAPPNVFIKLFRINDLYLSREYHSQELRENYENNKKHWDKKYSDEVRASKIESAKRNLMFFGKEDLSKLSKDELKNKLINAAMWCDAHDSLEKRRGFNKYGTNIELVFVRGPSLAIHVGSCDTSAFHFWVGTGVVEIRKNRYLQRIFSQTKLDSLKENGDVQAYRVKSPFLDISKNFEQIYVWDRRRKP